VEENYIRRCIDLAKKGRGYVSPNPLVGAIIVKGNRVLGEGFHQEYGGAHAEVNAFENAEDDVNGATLYCNLEPCCHTNKQTPPCVPLIIDKSISKVVISNLDLNSSVNGKGIKQLQDAGIKVITGILGEEGKELNKFYFKYVSENIPYITIKIAQSADGFLCKTKNEQIWLTGKEAVKYVHHQRAIHDAILIGANTVSVDNPLLTVREIEGRNPIRVIIDGRLSIPLDAKLVATVDLERTWIFTSSKADEEKNKLLINRGVKIFQIKSNNTKLKLIDILRTLAAEKITSLLVEGGVDIFNQFVIEELFDEITILQSPQKLVSGVSGFDFENFEKFKIVRNEKLGNDNKIIFKKR
jgi:diaminohydroxyphosphoribosylaminopyrimidine deaminase/5-amino-6-(5-phosphoribosylamino)uracil reductase